MSSSALVGLASPILTSLCLGGSSIYWSGSSWKQCYKIPVGFAWSFFSCFSCPLPVCVKELWSYYVFACGDQRTSLWGHLGWVLSCHRSFSVNTTEHAVLPLVCTQSIYLIDIDQIYHLAVIRSCDIMAQWLERSEENMVSCEGLNTGSVVAIATPSVTLRLLPCNYFSTQTQFEWNLKIETSIKRSKVLWPNEMIKDINIIVFFMIRLAGLPGTHLLRPRCYPDDGLASDKERFDLGLLSCSNWGRTLRSSETLPRLKRSYHLLMEVTSLAQLDKKVLVLRGKKQNLKTNDSSTSGKKKVSYWSVTVLCKERETEEWKTKSKVWGSWNN